MSFGETYRDKSNSSYEEEKIKEEDISCEEAKAILGSLPAGTRISGIRVQAVGGADRFRNEKRISPYLDYLDREVLNTPGSLTCGATHEVYEGDKGQKHHLSFVRYCDGNFLSKIFHSIERTSVEIRFKLSHDEEIEEIEDVDPDVYL